jgi:hypothetical protein
MSSMLVAIDYMIYPFGTSHLFFYSLRRGTVTERISSIVLDMYHLNRVKLGLYVLFVPTYVSSYTIWTSDGNREFPAGN